MFYTQGEPAFSRSESLWFPSPNFENEIYFFSFPFPNLPFQIYVRKSKANWKIHGKWMWPPFRSFLPLSTTTTLECNESEIIMGIRKWPQAGGVSNNSKCILERLYVVTLATINHNLQPHCYHLNQLSTEHKNLESETWLLKENKKYPSNPLYTSLRSKPQFCEIRNPLKAEKWGNSEKVE